MPVDRRSASGARQTASADADLHEHPPTPGCRAGLGWCSAIASSLSTILSVIPPSRGLRRPPDATLRASWTSPGRDALEVLGARVSAPLVLRGDRIVLSARDAQRAVGTYETGPLSNWYVEYMADALDAVFRALSDPTRRAILERLRTSDATVGELAEPFAMTVQAVSRHLKVLEAAGLVTRGREAQGRTSTPAPRPLRDAAAGLAAFERFWAARPDG